MNEFKIIMLFSLFYFFFCVSVFNVSDVNVSGELKLLEWKLPAMNTVDIIML